MKHCILWVWSFKILLVFFYFIPVQYIFTISNQSLPLFMYESINIWENKKWYLSTWRDHWCIFGWVLNVRVWIAETVVHNCRSFCWLFPFFYWRAVLFFRNQVEDVSKTRGVSVFGDIQRADNSYLHYRSHGR